MKRKKFWKTKRRTSSENEKKNLKTKKIRVHVLIKKKEKKKIWESKIRADSGNE